MRVTVYIQPKETVLDPQGAAVKHAMEQIGFSPASSVRMGKTITFEVEQSDSPELREQIEKMCHELLANPVIEDYRYELASEQ